MCNLCKPVHSSVLEVKEESGVFSNLSFSRTEHGSMVDLVLYVPQKDSPDKVRFAHTGWRFCPGCGDLVTLTPGEKLDMFESGEPESIIDKQGD